MISIWANWTGTYGDKTGFEAQIKYALENTKLQPPVEPDYITQLIANSRIQ